MDHDHSFHGIEGKGQRSRLGLWLGSQFETRSVGRGKFSSKSSFRNEARIDRRNQRSFNALAQCSLSFS